MNPVSLSGVILSTALLLAACSTPRTGLMHTAAAPQILRDCSECGDFVVIPRGSFVMGSDTDNEKSRAEGPAHVVRLDYSFALGRTEVTLGQFRRFVAATGYEVAPGCRVQQRQIGPTGKVEWRDDARKSWRDPGFAKPPNGDEPVVCVGHLDAVAYAKWLSQSTGQTYRLPSEAEWEYAARANATGVYFWGSNPDNGCAYANLYDRTARAAADFGWSYADCEDGFAELAPVAHFKPNSFGLFDMIGNAWEWTADCYHEFYDAQVPRDGRAAKDDPQCVNRSVRGGGWMTRPGRQRISFRGRDPNNAHYSYFGFRLARDLSTIHDSR